MEVCVYITQNKLSERSINIEPVNICARPVPTNHNLYQGNRVNADSHKHLWEKVVWKAGHSSSSLYFPAFHSIFLFRSLQMCRYVSENRQSGRALVDMEKHAIKTAPENKTIERTTLGGKSEIRTLINFIG